MTKMVGMGLVMLEVEWGLGRHRFFAKEDHYIGFLKYNFIDWCQVFITLAISKISICLFLLRISKFDRWRKFLYGVIAFLVVSLPPILFVYIFHCNPMRKIWDQESPGRCYSLASVEKIIIVQGGLSSPIFELFFTFTIARTDDECDNAVCSILTDVVLATFPILLIRNMKLPSRQKLALNLLFGLGALTAMICIVRTAFSYEVKAKDLTWQGVPNALCRIFEINLGIIAACMPMMRPLWNFFWLKWREHFHPSKTSSTRTPISRLQWYRAPISGPWYKRVRRHFQWPLRPPISKTSSTQSMNRSNHSGHNEKAVLPAPNPKVAKPVVKSKWPQEYEKPENVTWAKDADEPNMSDSIDLPLQGARKSDWDAQKEADWSEFKFNFEFSRDGSER